MENQLLIALSRNKLFRNIDISKIDLQNVKGKLITISEGEILYREGDSAEIIYLLVSGQVNVLKKRLLGKTKSYLFRENDFFGHEEYFEETSRTSTAVALVDSYLISLTRDEIDAVIKQNDEILVNLKEPVPENFIEELLQKENELANRMPPENPAEEIKETVENEPVIKPTVIDEGKTMDFFQSISDFSRRNDANIIQPLEKFKNMFEDFTEPDETLSLETSERSVEEKPMDFLTEPEVKTVPEPSLEHEPVKEEPPIEKLPFDEKAFLNEDGIPKAEFEIPEAKEEPQKIVEPEKKFNNTLDDALFQILSGSDAINFESLNIKEELEQKTEETVYEENLSTPTTKEPQQETEIKSAQTEVIENKEEPIQFRIVEEKEQLSEIETPAEDLKDIKRPTFDDYTPIAEIVPEINIPVQEQQEPKAAVFEEHQEPSEQLLPVIENLKYSIEETDNTPLPADFISSLERIFSSLNLVEVYKNIIDSGKGITSASYGMLFLLDWTRNELFTLVETGFGKREVRLKIGEGLAGFSAKSGETIIVNNIKEELRFKFDVENKLNLNIEKILVFPIKDKKNEIAAILELIKNQPEDFKPVDEEKLETLSIFFAMALRNANVVQGIIDKERALSLSKLSNFLEQDIKRPLLASKRYVEHLKTKNLQPDIEHVVDLLSEQVNQVSNVVTTIANYSENKMPLRLTNVSLNSTLTDFSLKAGQFVESKLCQIVNEFSGDTTVKMDIKEFHQCFMILIKNGCDAMPDGGKITVLTKRHGRNIEIHIKDNGCGISDEIKLKLFEPFMSENKKDGTGLGLAIAKKIIEAHNGSINVKSQIGEGADFIITLPIISAF